jgi:Mrp family chromosome partitioning ATPase
MPSPVEELRAAGIAVAAPDELPALRVECARLARRMREQRVRTVGLAPAADDVAVPAVAIELARAFAANLSGPVGVVDALGGWSCARALVEAAGPGSAHLATSWLGENLAVLTPRSFDLSAMLGLLLFSAVDEAADFDRLVVDLTGLDHLGELGALELLDAVALVARSGRTTARQVQRWLRRFPEGRSLGVILTGV